MLFPRTNFEGHQQKLRPDAKLYINTHSPIVRTIQRRESAERQQKHFLDHRDRFRHLAINFALVGTFYRGGRQLRIALSEG
jgi:hypothetical protein